MGLQLRSVGILLRIWPRDARLTVIPEGQSDGRLRAKDLTAGLGAGGGRPIVTVAVPWMRDGMTVMLSLVWKGRRTVEAGGRKTDSKFELAHNALDRDSVWRHRRRSAFDNQHNEDPKATR